MLRSKLVKVSKMVNITLTKTETRLLIEALQPLTEKKNGRHSMRKPLSKSLVERLTNSLR